MPIGMRAFAVREDESKGDMTPMIDVVFQLLIFFMLTIKFTLLEGKLSAFLPKDVGVNPTAVDQKEKIEIRLAVEREGAQLAPDGSGRPWSGSGPFAYGADRVIRYTVGPMSTTSLATAVARLRELQRADPELAATVDALPGTVYSDVVAVVDSAIAAGFRDIAFVADRSRQLRR